MENKILILTMILFALVFTLSNISFVSTVDENLGGGYKLISGSNDDPIIVRKNNISVISGVIIDYNKDSIFILTVQRPRNAIKGNSLKERERKLEKSTLSLFWIVNKITGSIYGPYSKEEYLLKKEELGVSDTLKLKIEKDSLYEYKYISPNFTLVDKAKEWLIDNVKELMIFQE